MSEDDTIDIPPGADEALLQELKALSINDRWNKAVDFALTKYVDTEQTLIRAEGIRSAIDGVQDEATVASADRLLASAQRSRDFALEVSRFALEQRRDQRSLAATAATERQANVLNRATIALVVLALITVGVAIWDHTNPRAATPAPAVTATVTAPLRSQRGVAPGTGQPWPLRGDALWGSSRDRKGIDPAQLVGREHVDQAALHARSVHQVTDRLGVEPGGHRLRDLGRAGAHQVHVQPGWRAAPWHSRRTRQTGCPPPVHVVRAHHCAREGHREPQRFAQLQVNLATTAQTRGAAQTHPLSGGCGGPAGP